MTQQQPPSPARRHLLGSLAALAFGPAAARLIAARAPGAVVNIASMFGSTDISDWCVYEALGEERAAETVTAADAARMFACSPVAHVGGVRGPLLLLLGQDDLRVPPHDGITGPRKEGSIGFSVIRGGGIIGDHDAQFISDEEILSISHRALDRAIFAKGALAAAKWAVDQKPGLYTMRDVLGL